MFETVKGYDNVDEWFSVFKRKIWGSILLCQSIILNI